MITIKLFGFALVANIAAFGAANAVVIDFDSSTGGPIAAGDNITEQYAELGVHFLAIEDGAAADRFIGAMESEPLAEPNFIRFTAGMRKQFWVKNCVSLGLAAGFIEPLESTSISLIHRGLSYLMDFFPDRDFDPRKSAAANRRMEVELQNIRDFIILHYFANRRDDAPFWRDRRETEIPDTLAHKIDSFKACGHIVQYEAESFKPESWLTMYDGFGITPDAYDARVNDMKFDYALRAMSQMQTSIRAASDQALAHGDFIAKYCPAPEPV